MKNLKLTLLALGPLVSLVLMLYSGYSLFTEGASVVAILAVCSAGLVIGFFYLNHIHEDGLEIGFYIGGAVVLLLVILLLKANITPKSVLFGASLSFLCTTVGFLKILKILLKPTKK